MKRKTSPKKDGVKTASTKKEAHKKFVKAPKTAKVVKGKENKDVCH